jgi:cystathionine beta-lyase/cystathionine gamma-synthase
MDWLFSTERPSETTTTTAPSLGGVATAIAHRITLAHSRTGVHVDD